MSCKVSLGQDSHRFELTKTEKSLCLGGIELEDEIALSGNSDADVILHAVTNSISGITGINILGFTADEMAQRGITDSAVYLNEALKFLPPYRIEHLSISVEGKKPIFKPHIPKIRENLARLLSVPISKIGFTATGGEGLTDFGKGLGIQCLAILTVLKSFED